MSWLDEQRDRISNQLGLDIGAELTEVHGPGYLLGLNIGRAVFGKMEHGHSITPVLLSAVDGEETGFKAAFNVSPQEPVDTVDLVARRVFDAGVRVEQVSDPSQLRPNEAFMTERLPAFRLTVIPHPRLP